MPDELVEARKLLGRWSLREAMISKERLIQERADKEAQVAWALKEVEPFEVIPPMPSTKWHPAARHAFLSKILP